MAHVEPSQVTTRPAAPVYPRYPTAIHEDAVAQLTEIIERAGGGIEDRGMGRTGRLQTPERQVSARLPPTAAQNEVVGQLTESSGVVVLGDALTHTEPSQVYASLEPHATAMQNEVVGQDTEARPSTLGSVVTATGVPQVLPSHTTASEV